MDWISHRGESTDSPENTIAAFDLALARHTDGSECDVYFTADGQLAISHDNHTDRMGDRCLSIEESTYSQLLTVDVSGRFREECGPQRIPLFEDVLKHVGKDRKLYVELKTGTPALAEAVKKVMEQASFPPEQIVIIAYSEEASAHAKKIMPRSQTLLLVNLAAGTAPETLIETLTRLKLDGVDAYAAKWLDAEFIGKVKKAGFFFSVWTVDHPGQARRLMDAGVDAITSDNAAKLRDLIEK